MAARGQTPPSIPATGRLYDQHPERGDHRRRPGRTDTLTSIERLQFADGLFDISGNPVAAPAVAEAKEGDAQVMPVLDDGKIVVGTEVLPPAPDAFAKDGGFEVMPTVPDGKVTVAPEVLPTIDDSFILTGKFDDLPPVMPTLSDEIDPWVMPTVFDPGPDFLSLVLEGPQHLYGQNLTLLDEWLTAPSRGTAWE